MDLGYYGIWLTNGPYASYWNAFLLNTTLSLPFMLVVRHYSDIGESGLAWLFWPKGFWQASLAGSYTFYRVDRNQKKRHISGVPNIMKNSTNVCGNYASLWLGAHWVATIHLAKTLVPVKEKPSHRSEILRSLNFTLYWIVLGLGRINCSGTTSQIDTGKIL